MMKRKDLIILWVISALIIAGLATVLIAYYDTTKAEEKIAVTTVETVVEESIIEETVVEESIIEETVVEESIVEETTTEETLIAETIFEDTTEKEPETEAIIEAVAIEPETTFEETIPETSNAVEEPISNNGYLGSFRITGYYPEEGFYEGKTCASGVGLHKGVCAMNYYDMKSLGITYGTTIYVEGVGNFTVYDTGCGPQKVDIWCYTKSEAYALPKYANVYIMY